jgi:hypothetical protein
MKRTAQGVEGAKARSSVDPATAEPKKKHGQHPNSRKNLVAPWKPGQSGNPEGKNGRDVAKEIAEAIFANNPEVIYQAFAKALLKGNAYAFEVIANRGFGKLKEVKEIEHKHSKMSDKELDGAIAALLKQLGIAGQIDALEPARRETAPEGPSQD